VRADIKSLEEDLTHPLAPPGIGIGVALGYGSRIARKLSENVPRPQSSSPLGLFIHLLGCRDGGGIVVRMKIRTIHDVSVGAVKVASVKHSSLPPGVIL
jgi:hypothetical protein